MQSLSKEDNSSTSFNASEVWGVKEGNVGTWRNEPEDILISLYAESCSKDTEQCLIDFRQTLFYSHIEGQACLWHTFKTSLSIICL